MNQILRFNMKFLILLLVCASECNAGVVGRSFKTESNILFDPDEADHHTSNSVSHTNGDENEVHHSSHHSHPDVYDDTDHSNGHDVHSDETENLAVPDKTSEDDHHDSLDQSHSHHSDQEHSKVENTMEQSSQMHKEGKNGEISEAPNSNTHHFEQIPHSEINFDNFPTNISIEVHSTAEGIHSHLNITIGNETFMSTSIPTDLHVNSSTDSADHISTLDNLDLIAQSLTDSSNELSSHEEIDHHEIESDVPDSRNVKVSASALSNDSQTLDPTEAKNHGKLPSKNNSNLSNVSLLVKNASDIAQNLALNFSLPLNQSLDLDFHNRLNHSAIVVSNQSSKNESGNLVVDTINTIVNEAINITNTASNTIVNEVVNTTKTIVNEAINITNTASNTIVNEVVNITKTIVNEANNITKSASNVVEIEVTDITKNAALAMDIFNISQDAVVDHLIQESILHDIIDMISPESDHVHKIQNDSSVILGTNITLNINSSVLQSNTDSASLDEKHDVKDFVKANNDTGSLTETVKDILTNFTNVIIGGQKINSTVGKLGKCPPPGFCLFSFWAQDTCATDNNCGGSMICCKIRCSKTCIEA